MTCLLPAPAELATTDQEATAGSARQPLVALQQSNAGRAVDFMSDTLYVRRRFRTLNILDEDARERLGSEVDTPWPAERVIRVFNQVVARRGQPQAIRLDYVPELIADRFIMWCPMRAIELRYIQPGEADQNAFVEQSNRTYLLTEVQDAYLFEFLDQVREISAEWGKVTTMSDSMMPWRALLARHVSGST